VQSTRTKETILIFIFAIVAIASGVDLLADLSHGASTDHIIKEAIVVVLSIAAIAWLIVKLRQQGRELRALREELASIGKLTSTPDDYVIEARKTLGGVVARQFSEWKLTGSETEVAWFLIKGLSLKEIAMVRNTQEKTVRQQASSIYKKSGVSGRHAFSAWFIEDIL
jgi:DNA-binding CsgD family transcriptional regulator